MEILIISGLSGAGKSKTASFLEDMGFYIVDNMPAAMILKFSEFCAVAGSRYRRVALVYDVRTAESPSDFFAVLEKLKGMETLSCRMLFLEAEPAVIIHRYKESRRMHPLHDDADSLDEAVRMERDFMRPVRDRADVIIDTSRISTARLRQELLNLFGESDEKGGMTVNVVSFGFKYGLPLEADLVFDVRFMPNPFYIEELRNLTGLDRAVSEYVFSFSQTSEFLKHIGDFLSFSLPLYAQEGKTGLVIAIGCTGGHHRSVAIAHEVANRMRETGYPVTEVHRDMGRGD
ncbi:MAG: RNase adapter RapZ [Oscillibacter sp.]|nr:RNase adapter RapZ [Oscillibacter sp.]MBQ7681170.1 RNase adapter RapZ [Oscillibacter sp.]